MSASDSDETISASERDKRTGEEPTQFVTWHDDGVADDALSSLGEEIGPFKVVRVLGRGGMGIVYEAEQANPRRRVALKVLLSVQPSREALRRFDYESAVLGRLHHPGIAQVYEAGGFETSVGKRPYFAMEFVDGVPLTDYASNHDLDLRQRLELFALVCDAVDHANAHGVVHRDLKPANILVDASGLPKVLDFGVARITDSDLKTQTLTQEGQIVGTLPYMSPEQVLGDPAAIDARTDVYGLGAVGFELLTGRLPLEVQGVPLPEAARMIRDEDPSTLSSIDRVYRGDVETVFGKALAKDPARRYARAADLASDIRSFLRDEPITARPPSTLYQLSKFASRNRGLVAGLAATFVALVGGVCVASWYAWQADQEKLRAVAALGVAKLERENADRERSAAERARAAAERERSIAEATVRFLNDDLLGLANPNTAMGESYTIRSAVDRAAATVGEGLSGRPAVQASIRRTLSDIYRLDGNYAEAEAQLRAALAVVPEDVFDRNYDRVALSNLLGLVLHQGGKNDEAEEVLTASLREAEERHGPTHPHIAFACQYLGAVLERDNDFERALGFYDRAHDMMVELTSPDDIKALTVREYISRLEKSRGNFEQALELSEEILAVRIRVAGPKHPTTLRTTHNIVTILLESSAFDRAEEFNDRLLDLAPAVFGPEHEIVALGHLNAGTIALERNDFEEAEEELLDAREMLQGREASDTWAEVQVTAKLGILAERRGRWGEAEKYAREALVTSRESLGERNLLTARYSAALARSLMRRGAYDEAAELLLAAQKTSEELAPESSSTANCTNDLAMLLMRQGRLEESEVMCRKANEMTRKIWGEDSERAAVTHENLGNVISRLGRLEEAEGILEEVLETRTALFGPGHRLVARTTFNIGATKAKLERFEEARAHYEDAISVTRASLGPDHPDVGTMTMVYGETLHRLGDHEALETSGREALRIVRLRMPPRDQDLARATRLIGLAMLETDRLEEAEKKLREQWTLQGRARPVSQRSLGHASYHLARCLRRLGDHDEAAELFEAAHSAYEKDARTSPARLRETCENLAACHDALGHSDLAERWRKAAREAAAAEDR